MDFTIKTQGLRCGHCDASVETALLSTPGVIDAEADHETQTVRVACDASVTVEQFSAAIEGAGEGFAVLGVEQA